MVDEAAGHDRLAGHPAPARAGDLRDERSASPFSGVDLRPPATGWKPRTDGRYAHPYVARKAARPRDQEHTQALLDELVAETAGLLAPAPRLSTGRPLPPLFRRWRALSFAICQVDEHGDLKLRREEDWRRSGHNATMGASDVPTHHFLGDIVDLILRACAEGWGPVVFGLSLALALALTLALGLCFCWVSSASPGSQPAWSEQLLPLPQGREQRAA